ncbi:MULTISPECIES: N-acyl homoserine lactonase family protein [unclassified Nocardioides]|uniref:N-acyl homoserine lactonase family protein n=1 Tax=unclassified Nocardioides TaxID=2615069 RepID=UPI0009F06135|nr:MULTISPECIES: N-acyl homoserine lactonase family protein [unclassified Nocardioides]GAW51840.1 Zn-dependent hydrolase, glyoxylase [Nocardioides sp. PD653-B2]GAW53506.1 Zn-dependent hydrolase, glyoxylase [Nocardioides sp. PD653]
MKLAILDLGRLTCDLSWQLAMCEPSRVSDPAPTPTRIELPVIATVVHAGTRVILFDTGCHPDAMSGRWPAGWSDRFAFSATDAQSLPAQLALVGLQPSDVTDVVLSHLHMDHAGNVGLFRHARIWVHRREMEHALAEALTDADYVGPYVPEDWLFDDVEWRFVRGPAVVVPGVELLPLPGHTPGTVAMTVELAGGSFIFPSDAVYMAESMGPPAHPGGAPYDSLGFVDTVDRLTYLRDRSAATIVFPHDPDQFATLQLAPRWYQ